MPRWLAVLLLAALLPWQSLVWAADATRAKPAHDGESHVVAHWLGETHHHDEDGGFQASDSDEAVGHLQADAHLNSLSLLPGGLDWTLPLPPSNGPPSFGVPLPPAPFLEGERRPPRLRA